MAVDPHIVGRVGEDHLRPLAIEQARIGLEGCCIAADQAVRADLPDVADLVTAGPATSGTASAGSGCCGLASRPPSSTSISGIEKPVTVTSKSRSRSRDTAARSPASRRPSRHSQRGGCRR